MITHFVVRSAKDFIKLNTLSDRKKFAKHALVNHEEHFDAAVTWLLRSIDVCGGNASSKAYRVLTGWMPPYPETSGYIIPTLLAIARERANGGQLLHRAERIARWLIDIQLPNGGFRGREVGSLDEPDVFDTGMILLGFNAMLEGPGAPPIRAAAQRAAEFLVASMDETGGFVRNVSHNIVHTYNVRSAWALASFGLLTDQSNFLEAGLANARWTLDQQNAASFYENNAFKRGGNANTHGLAYVMQGLLQIYELTGDDVCLKSVVRAAEPAIKLYRTHGWLAAELGSDWQYLSRHICLTGYAQLAIIFLRLFQLTGDDEYRLTADSLIADLAETQDLQDPRTPYYGAIAGSFPIYGRYAPLQYPNWATKFFLDALIARGRIAAGDRAPLFLHSG